MLNDKDTGEPLCLMSANLLSSARTGAVPAVAARYLADADARSIAILGCGPINRACLKAILTQLPSIERVYCYDLFETAATGLAEWTTSRYGIEAIVEMDLQRALKDAEVVTVAASRVKPLIVEENWLAPNATVLISGPLKADESFWTNSRIVFDSIGLHESYVEEAEASPDKQAYYNGVIGGPLYELIDAGKLPALNASTDIGQVIVSGAGKRETRDGRIAFIACGMSVFDLGWGYELYQSALSKNLGTELALWDEPYID